MTFTIIAKGAILQIIYNILHLLQLQCASKNQTPTINTTTRAD